MYNMTSSSHSRIRLISRSSSRSRATVSDLLLRVKLNVLSNDIRTKVTAGKATSPQLRSSSTTT